LGADTKQVEYTFADHDSKHTFKYKRYPDANIGMLKVRFCCRGDQ